MNVRVLISPMTAALLAATVAIGATRLTAPSPTDAADDAGDASVVRAQRFELIDATGAVTAIVGVDPSRDRPGLYVYDETGQVRAAFGNVVVGGGYGFFVQNEQGVARWVLGAGSGRGFAGFNVRDDAGHLRANMFARDDGTDAGFRVFGPDGQVIWQAP